MSLHDYDKYELENALPDYKYVRCIGEGAYGTVYLLEEKETKEMFAVKRISCFGLSEYELANALNEVRILASLDHPNIVKFYSGLFDNQHEHLYIFLQYANGGDAAQLITQAKEKKKRITENTVWKVLLNVAQAVQYLHKHDIAHRDIKPANIFKDKQTGFKLGDLNVSKILPQGSMTKTMAGSPFYISPEVWNHNESGYGSKCDIWSLGVVLYQLCCLRVPYEVDSSEEMNQILKITSTKKLPKYYSSSLNEVVQSMLEIDPKKRITADQIVSYCRKNLKLNHQKLIVQSESLMQTIVVPETSQRWINLVKLASRKISDRSVSSKHSTGVYSRKSGAPLGKTPMKQGSSLMDAPIIIKRTSRTTLGSKSKDRDMRLPSLGKYSIEPDMSHISYLIERKSQNQSKISENRSCYHGCRIRRNIVCQYIKEVREELTTAD